ncbi:MAG: RNA polymerase sigma factor [Planctomycetes bacterium]|nr:RNA polymerase sigma factor [Planctomycetota bacterium]
MTSLEEIFQHSHSVDLEGVLRLLGKDLFHYARVLTGSPELAEDAVQDTLVALLELGAGTQAVECPRAWLFTVLRRKALRQKSKRDAREASALELDRHLAESVEADPADRLVLQEAFGMLDPAAQEIAVLHLWEGLTFAEIAEVLGVPRGTALSTYHRGIQELRKRFGEIETSEGDTLHDRTASALPG